MSEYEWEEVPEEDNQVTAEMVQNHFIQKGYAPQHAAGIAANLAQESGFDPNAVNKKSGAYGLAQWLGLRKTALNKYAESNGSDPSDPITQMDFIEHELNTTESSAKEKLIATNINADAAIAFSDNFERAGNNEKNNARRAAIAQGMPSTGEWEDYSEADTKSAAIPEQGQQMSDLSYPELAKNAFLGASGRFEEAAAGLAGPLAPQSWLDKIASQKEWARTNAGSNIGDIVADTFMTLPLMFAGPAGLSANASIATKLAQPFKQVVYDALISALYGGGTRTKDRSKHAASEGLGSGLFSAGGQFIKGAGISGAKGIEWLSEHFDPERTGILQKAFKSSLGGDINRVISEIEKNRMFLPQSANYRPIVGELADNSAGINTLQSAGRNADPQSFQVRQLDNINANKELFDTIGATQGNVNATKEAMNAVGDSAYSVPRSQQVLVDTELRDILKRPMMRDAFNSLIRSSASRGTPIDPQLLDSVLNAKNGAAISGDAIHQMKVALDDHLKTAKSPFEKINQRDVNAERTAFADWREKNFPDYHAAQQAYTEAAKPYNRASALLEARRAVYPPESNYAHSTIENGVGLAQVLSPGSNIMRNVPGYSDNIRDVINPRDIKSLNRLAESMLRAKNARGGTAGSFEGSSLQDNSARVARIPAGAAAIASPISPITYPLINAAMFSKLEKLDKTTKQKLAEAMLNPDLFLEIIRKSQRAGPDWYNNKSLNRIPGIMGQITAQQFER